MKLMAIFTCFVLIYISNYEQGVAVTFSGLDSNNLKIYPNDSDGDGLKDHIERQYKTNPLKADTDGDQLSDFYEMEILKTSPLRKDTDHDGLSDREIKQEYDLPKNRWGIRGIYTGTGEIKGKLQIRQSPILLLQRLNEVQVFDLQTHDLDIAVHLQIPVQSTSIKLYRYQYQHKNLAEQHVSLTIVPNQQYLKNRQLITATVKEGDSFVLLDEHKFPNFENGLKKQTKPVQLSAQLGIIGLPGAMINRDEIKPDQTIVITGKEQKQKFDRVSYKIKEWYSDGQQSYLSLTPASVQSGKPIVILSHGVSLGDLDALGGTSTGLGIKNLWDNRNHDERRADAIQAVEPNQTFTGTRYKKHAAELYSNPDVQFITGITGESIGTYLVDRGYTVNQDLFLFEYDNDAKNIYWNSQFLRDYVEKLRKLRIGMAKVNLVTHSMGGLVARYYVENLDGQDGDLDVNQLITIGTPHFGAETAYLANMLEMVRGQSCFWNPKGKPYVVGTCEQLKGQHPHVQYTAIGGVTTKQESPPPRYGFYQAPDETQITDSTYADWVRRIVGLQNQKSIDDHIVRIDSALGSDLDYQGRRKPMLDFQGRYVMANPSGGGHGAMLRNANVKQKIYQLCQQEQGAK
ncbi:esterase/lipase family protein [Seinonella peptonophila]|nr:alpha/beta hydrolase [Seinonella peptonophila]